MRTTFRGISLRPVHEADLPFLFRLLARLPESTGAQGSRIWGGICLLKRR